MSITPTPSAVVTALRGWAKPAFAFEPEHLLIVGVNEAGYELLGREPGTLEGVDLRDVVHRDEGCAPLTAWELVAAGEIESYRARRHIHLPDGRRVPVDASVRIATVGAASVGLAAIEADHEATRSGRRPRAQRGGLSARQREVLTRLATGEGVNEIAAALYLSPSTVRNHLSVVYKKFGVHSQAGLLAKLFDEVGQSAEMMFRLGNCDIRLAPEQERANSLAS